MGLKLKDMPDPVREREEIRAEEHRWYLNRDRCHCRARRVKVRLYLRVWLCRLCDKLIQ